MTSEAADNIKTHVNLLGVYGWYVVKTTHCAADEDDYNGPQDDATAAVANAPWLAEPLPGIMPSSDGEALMGGVLEWLQTMLLSLELNEGGEDSQLDALDDDSGVPAGAEDVLAREGRECGGAHLGGGGEEDVGDGAAVAEGADAADRQLRRAHRQLRRAHRQLPGAHRRHGAVKIDLHIPVLKISNMSFKLGSFIIQRKVDAKASKPEKTEGTQAHIRKLR